MLVSNSVDGTTETRGQFQGGTNGKRSAWVLPERAEGIWVEVRRKRENGSLGWCTWHFTRWGARQAARLFERTGKTRGFKP
jgi:hypothetical protein